ncbi:MAG: hypothetical protein K1X92_09775 [Bacteroidia bacterium]|nr:hypothetical protein [Bacteroidia bacterium]
MKISVKKAGVYFLSFLAFLMISVGCHAQSKAHFRILENGNEVATAPFLESLETINLDYLRFIDERRTIPVENTAWIVELFSANELLTLYNKPVSPMNTPRNEAVFPNQVFVLSPGNTLKTKIID